MHTIDFTATHIVPHQLCHASIRFPCLVIQQATITHTTCTYDFAAQFGYDETIFQTNVRRHKNVDAATARMQNGTGKERLNWSRWEKNSERMVGGEDTLTETFNSRQFSIYFCLVFAAVIVCSQFENQMSFQWVIGTVASAAKQSWNNNINDFDFVISKMLLMRPMRIACTHVHQLLQLLQLFTRM